jgi:hypothetical protein
VIIVKDIVSWFSSQQINISFLIYSASNNLSSIGEREKERGRERERVERERERELRERELRERARDR